MEFGDMEKYEIECNRALNPPRVEKEYWIDRRGRVLKYQGAIERTLISMHYEVAKEAFPELEYPKDHVMKKGWVMVGSTCYGCPMVDRKPTASQLKTLTELGLLDRLHFKYKHHDGDIHYVSYKKYGILCK